MIKPSGHIFYEDEYNVKYEVQWETVGKSIDLTSIVQQPYVWGEEPSGFIKNGILYRKGIITIHRQILQLMVDGYIIIAEGTSQVIDFIQMNFKCERGPFDAFKYHLNSAISDDAFIKVSDGPRWADPSDVGDNDIIWCDIEPDGSFVESTGSTSLQWVDVWN